VKDLSYKTIMLVVESWEMIRQTKNHENVAGVKLFQRLATQCEL
jgi:hypothetical protein